VLPSTHNTEIVVRWPSGRNGLIDDVAYQLYSYYILAAAPVCTKGLVHIHRRREGTVLRSKSFVFLAILAEITSVTVSIDDELAVRCCKLLHYYGDQELVGCLW
jgi:hypothetical protein